MRPLLYTVLFLTIAAIGYSILPSIGTHLLGLDSPAIPSMEGGVKIYDKQDRLVSTVYGDKDAQPIALAAMSENIKKAIVAAEDHDFYSHDGVNPLSICRAIMVDVTAGHPLQGGSTISQQLVKNLYFEGKKRNLADKIKEAIMAIDMENRYSKEKILEGYLNHVYFGNGVYGVQRAAEYYFGKSASKLDIAESAWISGLVTAPSELSVVSNRKQANFRQQLILNTMGELKFASPAAIDKAKKEKLVFRTIAGPSRRYRYYTSEVLQMCQRELGLDEQQVFSKGLQIHTNLDPQAQLQAEQALANGIRRAPKGINQGALVSVSVADGAIVAMVGGAGSYEKSQWNRALSPHTAGSAFKPFVYLAALAKGVLSPNSLVADEPLEIRQPGAPTYRPRNFDGQFLGPMTIRKALSLSRNTCAVRVAQAVGPNEVALCAHRAGISSKLDENLALALGSSAVSPLEMAAAYTTLARNGEYIEPQMIRSIADADGKVLKTFTQRREHVFDPEPVAELVDALQDVVEKGTGTRARLFDRPVAGKTGTADQAKDIWFIGFTPDLVTAVWGGNDDNKAVGGHATGGTIMAAIWQNYMHAYYQQHHVLAGNFAVPEHPLMEEQEPLYIMPARAGIFDRLFGAEPAPEVREYKWAQNNEEPPLAPDRNLAVERRYVDDPPPKPKKKKKGIIKKFLNWLDD